MPAFLIVAHAPLATSLKTVAEHAYSECAADLIAIDVEPEADAEQLNARLLEAIAGREALIFTDMFGASPCNAARRVADGVRVRVLAGVNVPMLWRTLCYRHLSLEELERKALEGAAKGVMRVPIEQPQQHQSPAAARDDQVQRQDQQ